MLCEDSLEVPIEEDWLRSCAGLGRSSVDKLRMPVGQATHPHVEEASFRMVLNLPRLLRTGLKVLVLAFGVLIFVAELAHSNSQGRTTLGLSKTWGGVDSHSPGSAQRSGSHGSRGRSWPTSGGCWVDKVPRATGGRPLRRWEASMVAAWGGVGWMPTPRRGADSLLSALEVARGNVATTCPRCLAVFSCCVACLPHRLYPLVRSAHLFRVSGPCHLPARPSTCLRAPPRRELFPGLAVR